jgi:ABC-2 type transport system ATP-binding protein
MTLAIEARGLCRRFDDHEALKGVDLAIEPGVVYGLIGRNGAGKTTALRMLAGVLKPDRGTARVLGEDPWRASAALRTRVGYVAQSQKLPGALAPDEFFRYYRLLYPRWDDAYARELSRRWRIAVDRPIGVMSGGEQRRVAVALALAARPEVLLLDEPAAGLDPIARRELVDELVDVLTSAKDCAIVLSTHIVGDLERLAEIIGLMDDGRIVLSDRLDRLQAECVRFQLVFPDRVPESFAVPGAQRVQIQGPVMSGVARLDDTAVGRLRAMPQVRVQIFPQSLEDIVMAQLGSTATEVAA